MTEVAREVQELSLQEWGDRRMVSVVGLSSPLAKALEEVKKVADFDEPVLITGESGSGKEALAQAIYLLGPRRGQACVTVNCPQFQEGNLTVSELFGHRRGSFTGAIADRKGCFEAADGGVIFLDEIGDLHPAAQVMLLRALATGEFYQLGSSTPRSANVRVIAATNRNPDELRTASDFRDDLFFRVRYFSIAVPPLREREDDWVLLVEYFLDELRARYGVAKYFSGDSMKLLSTHDWPGNVRELASVVTSGYAMCDRHVIEPDHFVSQLMSRTSAVGGTEEELWHRIMADGADFWRTVHAAFMDRELNRSQVRDLVKRGLMKSRGSYRHLLREFNLPDADYQKFMDFLRHHRLKPGRD
jgi:transcriptional regulator with GAF, ATPase, and Fis domain